jgi:hypothetical protein
MAVSRGVRFTWVFVGSIFTVGTIGFGTVQAVAALAHEERDVHTVVREPVRVVDIEVDGSVTVVGGPAGPITIDERVSRGLQAPKRSIRVDGERLTVRGTCRAFPQTFCSDNVTLRVPSSVRLVADGLGITVSGTRGGTYLESDGDDVTVEAVGGAVRLRSHGGSVSAIGLRATDVDADSSGGDVSLAFAGSPQLVDARSSGGGVNVVLPDRPVAYRVETSASGGSVDTDIRTDPTSPRLIRATSSGGGITIHYADR